MTNFMLTQRGVNDWFEDPSRPMGKARKSTSMQGGWGREGRFEKQVNHKEELLCLVNEIRERWRERERKESGYQCYQDYWDQIGRVTRSLWGHTCIWELGSQVNTLTSFIHALHLFNIYRSPTTMPRHCSDTKDPAGNKAVTNSAQINFAVQGRRKTKRLSKCYNYGHSMKGKLLCCLGIRGGFSGSFSREI